MTRSTPMTTDEMWRAVAAERASLVELLETFSEADWNHGSLCEGWRVRDVIAHIVLSARPSLGWILVNVIRARGSLDRAIRDTAIRLADRTTTSQLLAALRDSIGVRSTPIGTNAADRLMDLLVHGQDIAVPLGITREMPIDAARAALERVWTTDTFRSREKFAGYHLVATDAGWDTGAGLAVEGPVASLLLLLTGRRAGQERLTGEGAERLITDGKAR
ncbi:maleylpyruvate isomerase family mycothiol-dependent enzyme [Nocardia amamiensis]|uniref:Maleylpyruvate isomerase family mycothiol-dependent enzyme n=1 Tax=Nocardia amamiensis TaxID=404578 RepID=A0ABS0CT41_9NOCA|nr:maleylpyruvate isomerase family mycothiol-dependent enzyme [Nocardia amamiensis]MBF6299471.1 maleylpyruvate isomerase family mycothiol-dependent enzyme [Nocardia amamiensis]